MLLGVIYVRNIVSNICIYHLCSRMELFRVYTHKETENNDAKFVTSISVIIHSLISNLKMINLKKETLFKY